MLRKKIIYTLICALVLLLLPLTGCKNIISRLTQISVPYTVENIELEGLPALLETVADWNGQDLPFPSVISFQGREAIENQAVSESFVIDLIDVVRLEKLELSLDSAEPEDKDIGFIQSIYIFINSPGLDKELFAYVDDVPKDARTVALTTTNDNLAEFFREEEVELHIMARAQEIPSSQSYTFNLSFEVFVDVKILGY